MTESQLSQLIEKYLKGEATDSEKKQLEQWYASFDEREISFTDNVPGNLHHAIHQGLQAVKEKIKQQENSPQRKTASPRLWSVRPIAAAAAILLLIAAATFMLTTHKIKIQETATTTETDFNPGGNRAVLTLGNGSKIVLDSSNSGLLSIQGGVQVVKTGSGRVIYDTKNTAQYDTQRDVPYNTITVPRGGQYQVILPDGSKVWLNAGSFLRFPTAFTGNTRTVQMSGEAYFEIRPNAEKPFLVRKEGSLIKVLGTHFNVSAYEEERTMTVTLLEGRVVVMPIGEQQQDQQTTLTAGEQLIVETAGDLWLQSTRIKKANLQAAIAWKEGLFWFENDDIHQIMAMLSRWYNVDIAIQGSINDKFTGSIPRNLPFSKIFEILQKTGSIRYEIVQHKIIVSPYKQKSMSP